MKIPQNLIFRKLVGLLSNIVFRAQFTKDFRGLACFQIVLCSLLPRNVLLHASPGFESPDVTNTKSFYENHYIESFAQSNLEYIIKIIMVVVTIIIMT